MELVQKALEGNSQSLARLVSLIEREAPEEPEIMSEIFRHTGKAHHASDRVAAGHCVRADKAIGTP